MPELLPCPACGGTGTLAEAPEHDVVLSSGREKAFRAKCASCGACGPVALSRKRAAASWNAMPKFPRLKAEPPSEAGCYFFRRSGNDHVSVVNVFASGDRLFAAYFGLEDFDDIRALDGEWARICEPKA